MAIFSDSPSVKPTDVGTSMEVHKAVGSGSRPTSSRVKIMSSAPTNPKTLSRDVPGSLK